MREARKKFVTPENRDQKSACVLLLTLSASAFIWPFLTAGANIALPAIAREFDVDAVRIGWVTHITLLFTAISLLPTGRLATPFGLRRTLLSGIGIAVGSTIAVSGIRTYEALLFLRAIQGIGAALMSTAGMTILATEFKGPGRSTALGIYTAAVYLGLSAGPFLGGLLVTHFHWRGVFYFLTLVSATVWFFAYRVLPRKDAPISAPQHFDFAGCAIYSSGLVLVILGMDRLDTVAGAAVTFAGFALVALFLAYERVPRKPLIEVALFKNNKPLLLACLACVICYAAVFAVSYLLSLYLQYAKGFSARSAGLVLVTQPLTQAFFSAISGKFSTKTSPAAVATTGMGLTATGLFFLIWLDAASGVPYVIAVSVLLGIGIALFAAPNNDSILSAVAPEHYGTVSGMLGTLRLVGQLSSMIVVTIVFSLVIGHTTVTAATLGNFLSAVNISFAVMTALCALSTILSLWRGRERR